MAACNRKTFNFEWEAYVYIREHPWPEPAPPVAPFMCHTCNKFHITDKIQPRKGRNGRKKR